MKALVLCLLVMGCGKLDTAWTYKDYPCTPSGKVCPGGMCCNVEEDCGGSEVGCPAGMCCYVGGFAERGKDGGAQ